MLPKQPSADAFAEFVESFSGGTICGAISADDARLVLRVYRASLPPGMVLPESVVRILALSGITVQSAR